MRKIDQKVIDTLNFIRAGVCGQYTNIETLDKIRSVLLHNFDVEISKTEAHVFWRWRCECWDGTFFAIVSDDEIIEWYVKYVDEFNPSNNDEDDE